MSASVLRLSIGRTVALSRLDGDQGITERLMDMGLHPGVELELIGRMPMGGPLIVRVETTFLALREEEAMCLKVNI
jgi:ferrous iron transport protein A